MIFIIKSIETKEIHEAVEFKREESGKDRVWSPTWPGEHVVGVDCEWLNVSQIEAARIKFIMDNPDMTAKQIAKELCVGVSWVCRLKNEHNLQVRSIKKWWRAPKAGKPCKGKMFDPNSRNNWMI